MELPLRQTALGDFEHELAATRRVLERVPDAQLGWRPHERSWTLAQLATHIANLLRWLAATASSEGIDLAETPPPAEPVTSRDGLLALWDENVVAARGALEALSEAELMAPWTLRRGDRDLFTMPRLAVVRSFSLNHLCHHRGQLTVYLRLLDVPLPPLYGPTADEAPTW